MVSYLTLFIVFKNVRGRSVSETTLLRPDLTPRNVGSHRGVGKRKSAPSPGEFP
jgi:hypothetical protein